MPAIYLDHNASTPIHPAILERVCAVLAHSYGNPGSPHGAGRAARSIIEEAREQVAACFGFPLGQVTFTGSGTEALNTVINGCLGAGDHVIYLATEHKAVLEPLAWLVAESGVTADPLPVDRHGRARLDLLPGLLKPETRAVIAMAANNEVGTLQPLTELRTALPEGCRLLVDAAQAAGRLKLDWSVADALIISGHKMRAPKGGAALLTRPGLELRPLLRGGSQERERRAGTEDTAAIAGLGLAASMMSRGELFDAPPQGQRQRRFEAALSERVRGLKVLGQGAPRLPQTASVHIAGWSAEKLIVLLDLEGILVSAGSACSSGSLLPSHVLLAMGASEAEARSTLRLSFGPETTSAELERCVEALARLVGPPR